MNEVKRYEHTINHADSDDPESFMIGNSKGAWVRYEDYAALQQNLDAVLAENVTLKETAIKALEEVQQSYDSDGIDSEDEEGNFLDSCITLFDAESAIEGVINLNTPATDALLNAVRAEGIEILTGKLQQLIDEGVFDAKEIGVAAGAVHEGSQIAAQLRAETDTTPSQYESLAGGK